MIREADTGDAKQIAGIIVEAWQTAYEGIVDPGYPKALKVDRFIDLMSLNIRDGLETILVYVEGDTVLGFVSGRQVGREYDCETVGLYVKPGHQGMGIGGVLLEAMMSYFQKRGCRKMMVKTLARARNNAFYTKHGGMPGEDVELTIGDSKYPGVVFSFKL